MARDKDKAKEYHKMWREKNREKIIVKRKKYYNENKDSELERHKRWQLENADYLKSYYLEYYTNNHDDELCRAVKYRLTPDGQANSRKWRSIRRATNRGHKINWTPEDHARVSDLFQKAARRSRVTGKKFHVDHRVPLARGGAHHPDNMQVVCAKYNLSKGAKLEEEFSHKLKQGKGKNK
jgi:hypothetical protein